MTKIIIIIDERKIEIIERVIEQGIVWVKEKKHSSLVMHIFELFKETIKKQ
jgi:hypothetical protein